MTGKQDTTNRLHKYDEDIVIKAIEGTFGVTGNIVRKLRCSYATFNAYVERSPRIAEALQAERESVLDLAENVVIANMRLTAFAQRIQYDEEGNVLRDIDGKEIIPTAQDIRDARWVLSRRGANRGYGENVGVNVKITSQDINKAIELELGRVKGVEELAAFSTVIDASTRDRDGDDDSARDDGEERDDDD